MNNEEQMNEKTFNNDKDMKDFLSKKAEDIVSIQKHISDALVMADKALSASHRAADMNVGLFFHRKNIIALQENAIRQGMATSSMMEAIMLLFDYQRKMAEIMKSLFEIGAMNIANNRAMIKELESLIKDGSDHKLCEEAISQLKDVKTKLENQKDYLEKIDSHDTNIKSLALDSVIVHKSLLELKEDELAHEFRLKEYERFARKIEGEKLYTGRHCPKCDKRFKLGALICPSCGEILYGMNQNMKMQKRLTNILKDLANKTWLFEKVPYDDSDYSNQLEIKKINEVTQVFKQYINTDITDEISLSYYDEILIRINQNINKDEDSENSLKILEEINKIIMEFISINHNEYNNNTGQIEAIQNDINIKESEIRRIRDIINQVEGIVSNIQE